MVETMIRKWTKALQPLGFRLETSGRHSLFLRERLPIRQLIAETHDKYTRSTVRVDLVINIDDPFQHREEGLYPVALMGWVRRQGEVMSVDLDQPSADVWWGPIDVDAALKQVLTSGLPWLEDYSDMRRLITLFESQLRDGIPIGEPKNFSVRVWERVLFRQSGIPTADVRRPPINHYWLSLLYYHTGEYRQGCEHARRWLDFHRGRPAKFSGPEPDRTLRHLAAMNCG